MTYARYNGHATQMYPDYIDVMARCTLTAEPGCTYDIRAVSGHPVPPGDGRWSAHPVPAEDAPRPPYVVDVELPPLTEPDPDASSAPEGEPPTGPAAPEGESASPESEE